jgi:hypothetical protein
MVILDLQLFFGNSFTPIRDFANVVALIPYNRIENHLYV